MMGQMSDKKGDQDYLMTHTQRMWTTRSDLHFLDFETEKCKYIFYCRCSALRKNSGNSQTCFKWTHYNCKGSITKDFFLCTPSFQFLQYWIWYVRSLMFLNRRIWIGTTFITLGLYQIRCYILIVNFHTHWLDEYFQRFQNATNFFDVYGKHFSNEIYL